ncbi:MAG: 30S ribosomal protein S16 [Planctomycetota bacterium]
MVRIRMQRLGRRNRPFYRINAIDKRRARDGKVIENLGWYNPVETDPDKQVSLKEDRIRYWLSVGAQPSDTVRDFLAKADIVDRATWEADRKSDRDRVTCKQAVGKAEAAVSAIAAIAEESDANLSAFATAASEALAAAKAAVSGADADAAQKAVAAAESAQSDAQAAADKAKAEAEAKAAAEAAEAEKAAAAEAASEESGDDSEDKADG